MKKILSITLSVIFLISIFPLSVFANEQEVPTHDEIINMACEVFPEYTEIITNQNIPSTTYARTQQERQIVKSITREASEDTMMNYTEYSDGVAILSSYTCPASKKTVNHTTIDGGYITTVNITVTCTISDGVFYLTNLEYKTLESGYDSIVDIGTPSSNSDCQYSFHSKQLTENASSNAFVKYLPYFLVDGYTSWYYSVDTFVTFTVGDNTAWLTSSK